MARQKKKVEEAKIVVDETIAKLEEKGVNVSEITAQQEFTEKRTAVLDEKVEKLTEKEKELVQYYVMQKEKQLEEDGKLDVVKLRTIENKSFF